MATSIPRQVRSATNAEYVEMSLVETHIAQCQTGKQTRQKNERGSGRQKQWTLVGVGQTCLHAR